jgi:hypothetical protein
MDVRQSIIDELANGKSLSEICLADGMPNRSTVQRWQNDDDEFDAAVTHAREVGFAQRAERAVMDAKVATDASLGRLAFDAERWYLGKLSNAFSESKPQKHEHTGSGGGAININVNFD